MLKGLLTRQIFMFVDVALAVLTVFVAYQVFTKLFQDPSASGAGGGGVAEAPLPELPKVGSRADYDIIVASRLFGDAGEKRIEKEEALPPVTTDVVPTQFTNLKLKGTSFAKVRPNALIEQTGAGANVYEVGQEVIPGQAKLLEIHNRKVILLNLSTNKREELRMDPEEDLQMASSGNMPGPIPAAPPPPRNANVLKKEELQEELQTMTDNLADLISTTNPHPVQNENGEVIGFTADNIGSVPLAAKLGFRDGDIVKEINGQKIESLESITSVIEKYQNANNFHVTVVRDGKPTLLRFKLE